MVGIDEMAEALEKKSSVGGISMALLGFVPLGLFLLPFGLPPSLPLLRAAFALFLLVTLPRHAGQ